LHQIREAFEKATPVEAESKTNWWLIQIEIHIDEGLK
jgi:hypothetical protein